MMFTLTMLFSYLWEQFNIINMNLSIFIILGHVCMLLTDLDAIKLDRHLCTAIGCLIQLAYTSTALILAAECHACFKVSLLLLKKTITLCFNIF